MVNPLPVDATDVVAEHDVIDVLLEDPEWLDAAFLAVMRAAGFVEPFRIATADRPHDSWGRPGRGARAAQPGDGRATAIRAEARIRSPPST